MDTSVNPASRPAFSGGAKAFVAARRRRREQLQIPPALHWDSAVAVPGDDGGMPVWSLRLGNDGGDAGEARVVLFTSEVVVRSGTGEAGHLAGGERWELTLDAIEAHPSSPIWGYVLARGGDARWHALTIDGRSASFRTEPDELGVLRTLGLRLSLGAVPQDAPVRSERRAV